MDIEKLLKNYSFPKPKKPFLLVLRETDKELNFQKDNSDNNCDSVLLSFSLGKDHGSIKYRRLAFGSFLNSQKVSEKDGRLEQPRANYIASGFYPLAWRKGHHRGYRCFSTKS